MTCYGVFVINEVREREFERGAAGSRQVDSKYEVSNVKSNTRYFGYVVRL